MKKQKNRKLLIIFLMNLTILVFTGVAKGYYAELVWQSTPFDSPTRTRVYDTDKDGHKEIIFADEQRSKFYVFEHTDDHNYILVWESPKLGWSVEGVTIGDADSDGKAEIITWDDSPGKFYVFENVGDNSYTKVYEKSVAFDVDEVIVGDADNDGKQEIIVGAQYYVHVYENTGDNSYSEVWKYKLPYYNPDGIAVDDADEDSRLEIIVSNDHKIYVFENTGDDSYDVVWISDYIPTDLGRLITADADKDGKKEIVVGGHSVYVFENIGDNTYSKVWETDLSGAPLVADSDKNGRKEIIFSHYVFENTGDNNYVEIWRNESFGISTVADTNNDGRKYELIGTFEKSVAVFEVATASVISGEIDIALNKKEYKKGDKFKVTATVKNTGTKDILGTVGLWFIGFGDVFLIFKAEYIPMPVGFEFTGDIIDITFPGLPVGTYGILALFFDAKRRLLDYDIEFFGAVAPPLADAEAEIKKIAEEFIANISLEDIQRAQANSLAAPNFLPFPLNFGLSHLALVPLENSLEQNYPNPFNPDTWIPFKLAQDTPVIINIYDTKGQLVRTISLGNKNAGIYTTKDKAAYWDGCDNLGDKVSSGVYYYTLQAGDFTATRKMVIMK